MKTIIHFGPPKTGTSAIQWWCNANTDLLEKHGVFYPRHNTDRNEISSGNTLSVFDKDEKNELYLNKEKVKTLIEDAHKNDAKVLFLSSEYFFLRLPLLIKAFPMAHFLGYVRNPLEILDSTYNQSVKRHKNTSKIPLTENINCNSLNQLRGFIEKHKDAQFDLRAYNPDKFVQGTIVSDLLNYLDLNETSDHGLRNINTSYSHSALETKRWLNRLNLGKTNARLDSALQTFTDENEKYTVIPDEFYSKYQSQAYNALKAFTEKYSVTGSTALLERAKSKNKPEYFDQDISMERFSLVVEYLRKTEPHLFKKLQHAIIKHYGTDTLEEKAKLFIGGSNLIGISRVYKKLIQ